MKAIDIALRDMLRSFKSLVAVMFGFVIPLVMVVMLKFLMGVGVGGDSEFNLPVTKVQVVNLDEGGGSGNGSLGDVLVDFLTSDELSDLLKVTIAENEATARQAVDNAEAAVAVIIPANFTQAVYDPEGSATVVLYNDPTLTFGPGLVRGIVKQVLDGFSGSRITIGVVAQQLVDHGQAAALTPELIRLVNDRYVDWVMSLAEGQSGGQTWALDYQPVGEEAKSKDIGTSLMSGITLSLMLVFVFSTGSATAQSVIREEEEGTLRRLFTAPVTLSAILSGKILGTVFMLVVQVATLLVLSSLIFGINWGYPLPVALSALALVLLASSFGIFVMSLIKNSTQVGIVQGGLMTIFGIVGTYPAIFPAAPSSIKQASLVVPHGWAMRTWLLAHDSPAISGEMLFSLAVMFGLSAVFFLVGLTLFRRRFE